MLTIAPPPRVFRYGSATLLVTNVVFKFCDRYSSHCAADSVPVPRLCGVVCDTPGPRPTPALFTTTSSPPNRSTTDRTAFAVSASGPSRSRTATRAPCDASTRAIPAPIPRAPPVTIAVFPVSMAAASLALRVRRHAGLLDEADGGARSVDGLRPRHRLLHAGRHLPAQVARHVRIPRTGHDDAADTAQPLERMRRQDAVNRVEGKSMPVRVDMRLVARELLLEAGVDLVRVARLGEHALPHLGIRGVMHAVPRLADRGRHDDGAARLSRGVDHAAQIPEAHGDEREDRIQRRPDGIGARVRHAVHEDVDRLGRRRPPRREAPRLDLEGGAARLVDAAGEHPRDLKRVGEQRVELEDAPPEARLEMSAHLV